MPLWFQRQNRKTFSNMELVSEFIDVWLQTRKSEDIDASELSGVIDFIYDVEPAPGKWALIEVKPSELKSYITVYVSPDGVERKTMMKQGDWRLSKRYVQLLNKGYEPTPIIIAGAEDPDTKERGITLIDGRHRIYAADEAGLDSIMAYIPRKHLPMMKEAKT
jgi:hypothetical protein